jgi:hypothetical protein
MIPSLGVVITAHKEGILLNATVISALTSMSKLQVLYNSTIEILIYLDNPDLHTKEVATTISNKLGCKIYFASNGDPGLSRMDAISQLNSDLIALLDGDDLWSSNWLVNTFELIKNLEKEQLKKIIFHPEYNYIFGNAAILVRQGDPEAPFFNSSFLRVGNYWDALCLAHREIFRDHPYQVNDFSSGVGHEDYLWSCSTFLSGIQHKLVPKTIHFKRRRINSISALANQSNSKPVVTEINHYDYNEKI